MSSSFRLSCSNWSFDADLQIVHADVQLEIDGEMMIDEPLCVDVGMPALLLSLKIDTDPDRWSEPEEWERKPFFCCGCGDPECRAFSFQVRHEGDRLKWIEVEERQNHAPRMLDTFFLDKTEVARQVRQAARGFVAFVEPLPYRPLYEQNLAKVKQLLHQDQSGDES